ncbi:MAG: hypothetical protein MZV70_04955 [Desulfobacterales bacterium]|nr:hypothetical protein [Desulfobacterales bacterium]
MNRDRVPGGAPGDEAGVRDRGHLQERRRRGSPSWGSAPDCPMPRTRLVDAGHRRREHRAPPRRRRPRILAAGQHRAGGGEADGTLPA